MSDIMGIIETDGAAIRKSRIGKPVKHKPAPRPNRSDQVKMLNYELQWLEDNIQIMEEYLKAPGKGHMYEKGVKCLNELKRRRKRKRAYLNYVLRKGA